MRPFATIFGLLEDIHISTNIPRKIARFARCKFWGSKMSNPEQSTTKFLPSWNFCKPCQSGGEERYAQGWSAGQETLKSKVGARKPRVRGKQPGPHRWTVSNRIAHVASQTPWCPTRSGKNSAVRSWSISHWSWQWQIGSTAYKIIRPDTVTLKFTYTHCPRCKVN